MPEFNVLQDPLPLNQNYFLEASAGTGKTFAIEKIFLRLLLEHGFSCDKILVVTFTRAATAELKRRIRTTLEEALAHNPSAKVRRALALFDEAKIFTIHSFCASLLQEELLEKKEGKRAALLEYMRDFFRTEAHNFLTLAQWDKLVRLYGGMEELLEKVLPLALKKSTPVFDIRLEEIQKKINATFLNLGCYELTHLKEDLSNFASLHKGMNDRSGALKKEVAAEINQLEEFLADPFRFTFLAKMQVENRLLRKKELSFHYPHLINTIAQEIIPLISKGLDEELLLATLVEGARAHLAKVAHAENILLLDDIVPLMEQKLQDPAYLGLIQTLFQAVLIDEFQDTDATQWKLFKTLFLGKVPLFLIGDPKQAIYRFRGGDIYTYLEAKNQLEGFHGELSCNFRSDPPLVEAINCLFSLIQPFQTLPKTGQVVAYLPVKADPKKQPHAWKDGKSAIHFFEGESEEALFSAFIEEIHQLHKEYQIPYSQCAILVNDRYQAKRFQMVAKKMGLPTLSKKNNLFDSPAYSGLIQLLEAIIECPDPEKIVRFLSGPLFNAPYTHWEAEKKIWIPRLAQLKKTLESGQILCSFRQLMEKYRFYEKILSQPGGDRLYSDLTQLCDMLAMEKPHNYLSCLKKLPTTEEEVVAYSFSLTEAAPLLTMHGSKGLEFEIVFVPGVIVPMAQTRHKEEYEEMVAERMRLFYVAVTRAKKRAYLPMLEGDTQSIMGIFSARTHLKSSFPDIFSRSSVPVETKFIEMERPAFSLCLPSLHNRCYPSIPITSFTHLVKAPSEERKSPPPDTLPLGATTGTILHTILERVPLDKFIQVVNEQELIPIILPFIHNTPLSSHASLIAQMLYKTFHKPLPYTSVFTLSQIDPKKTLKEVEFLYFCQERGAYLKGFIDLCFEFKKKLYFVDWKTNYLENYNSLSMLKEMEAHNYHLQRKIYQEAMQRYAKLFPDIAPGGSFYIFLRALGEDEGIVFA